MSGSTKKIITYSLRTVITLILLFYIINRLNLERFLKLIREAQLIYIIIALLILAFSYFVNTYAWRLLLGVQGIEVPFSKLTSYYLIGLFFNNFLLSSVGGDIIKAYQLARYTQKTVESSVSIVASRFATIFALLILCLISSIIGNKLGIAGSIFFFLSLVFLCSLILVFIFFNINFLSRLKSWFNSFWSARVRDLIFQIYNSVSSYRNNQLVVFKVIVFSLVFQIFSVLASYIISLALGLKVSILYFLIFIPLIRIVILLPISFNGLGLREGAFVTLFSKIGVPPEMSFSISIIGYFMLTCISLIGGILYLFSKR
jgi:uncharacterized protein (TIRG00374 family)